MRPALKWRNRQTNQNVFEHLVSNGIDCLNATVIANRVESPDVAIEMTRPQLKHLSSPQLMEDMDKAVERIVFAIQNNETIGLETDHDCDGQTSHAVLHQGLTELIGYPSNKIRSYIGHRMDEGYGLSDALADRILVDSPQAKLIITADNGSTDEPRISRLKMHGIDTIVTDHHAIPPEGIPMSAVAVLNPTRNDCQFPDPYIAGCMVSWLLIGALRRYYIENNLPLKNAINLVDLLDFVAVGTVADCVSMSKSLNNRVVTHYGLQLIQQRVRPCWKIFTQETIDSGFLGFTVGPLLNADGRLSDAMGSLGFLLESDQSTLSQMHKQLTEQNQQRKQIQKRITDQALTLAQHAYQSGRYSICVYLHDGHAGVHGISASRIKDTFGLPTIIFSPRSGDETIITGSARSIDGLDLKAILDDIHADDPKMFVKYGGHSGAAGMTIPKIRFTDFVEQFEHKVAEKLSSSPELIGPFLDVDMALQADQLTLEIYTLIERLEPFGRQFELPIFSSIGKIVRIKIVGKDQSHVQLFLNIDGKSFKGIWFFGAEVEIAGRLSASDQVRVCYALQKEEYLGDVLLSLNIKHIEYCE